MLAVNNSPYLQGIIQADGGSLNNLDVEGSLTMGGDGKITNTAGDYTLDEKGLMMDSGQNFRAETAITWDGSYVDVGIYSRSGAQGDFLRVGSERIEIGRPNTGVFDVALSVDTRSGFEAITANLPVRLPRYTDSSRPSNPDPGWLIYNTDAANVQMADNNGNWQGLA